MKVEVTKEVKIVLTLTEAEAKWLHNQMQNPLHGQDLAAEDEADQLIRYDLFKSLTNIGL